MTVVITEQNRHQYAEALWDPKRKKDPGEQWTAQRRADMEQFITQNNGARPVTILNLNPFPLQINGGVFFPDSIPACPLGQPYTVFRITQTRWGHRDIGSDAQGMMQMEPFAAIPMVQAAEYIREFGQQESSTGGVICYIGDEDPATFGKDKVVEVPEVAFNPQGVMYIELKKRNFHEILAAMKRRQKVSTMRKLQQANNWHEIEAMRININDTYRDQARLALQEGWIKELPSWTLHENTDMEAQAVKCPSCRAVPNAGAVMCTNCGYVFNVIEAYRIAIIGYGHVSMERLTAKEFELVKALKTERDRAQGKVNGQ